MSLILVRDTIHNIVSHKTMTQHIYYRMIVTKLIKQYPLMLMGNVVADVK